MRERERERERNSTEVGEGRRLRMGVLGSLEDADDHGYWRGEQFTGKRKKKSREGKKLLEVWASAHVESPHTGLYSVFFFFLN